MFKKNIRTRSFYDTWVNDGTVWEINTSNIGFMALIGFFVGSLFALIPLMFLVAGSDFALHVMWFYKHQFLTWTNLGPWMHIESYLKYDRVFSANAVKLGSIYFVAYLVGALSAIWFGKIASAPISPTKHVRGRRLIADAYKNMAFKEIFRISNIENRAMKSFYLPILSTKGLTPLDKTTYMRDLPKTISQQIKLKLNSFFGKINEIIWFSIDRLNTHLLVFGATRTGKSQLIKRMLHMVHRMQILFMKHFAGTLNSSEKEEFEALTTLPYTLTDSIKMALGQKVAPRRRFPIVPKMVIYGVKPEYSEEIMSKYAISIGAHDLESYRWAIQKDLITKQHAQQYFSGWIGVGDPKNEFWNFSQINYGASGIVYQQKMNGDDWNMGTLAWYFTQSLEFKKEFVNKHYLEVSGTFALDGEVMSNVIGSFGAKIMPYIIQLADIYCGYYEKQEIAQMTTTLLRREHNIELFSNALFPTEKRKELSDGSIEVTSIPDNKKPQLLIRGLIRSLNKKFPLPEQLYDKRKQPIPIDREKYRWPWKELVELINKKSSQYMPLALNNLTEAEKAEFLKLKEVEGKEPIPLDYKQIHNFFINGCIPILKKFKIWERFETKIREVSLREWLLNPMPEKPIIIFQSSGEYSVLNNGIIRAMSSYMTGLIDSEMFPDNNKLTEDKRRDLWIFCDEFPFFGDMKAVINPILARGASKGVKIVLAAQDLSQIETDYGADFVKFLCSNVGNIFVTGANAGETADKVAATTGKEYFIKDHTTVNGPNQTSSNKQQHEEAVLTPDEVVNELGVVEVNGTLQTRTLYMGARYFNDAYVFYSPVVQYPQKHRFKPALWTTNFIYPESSFDIEKLVNNFDGELEKEEEANNSSNSQILENPSFEDLLDEPGLDFNEEQQETLAKHEKEELDKARRSLLAIQDNTPDIPLEIDEKELNEEMIVEKLMEEIFGHEAVMAKITLELLDNLLYTKQIKLKPEEKRMILKYMEKKHPECPHGPIKHRTPIHELFQE